ncbi:hypothetical protein AB0280_17680 [Pseudarthrobacter sp902506025]|uniref:hypothetical protein n=1 Tax=Pseudarthrobacter sp. 902506025 TaxID=3155291 RepID=UPI00344DCEFD
MSRNKVTRQEFLAIKTDFKGGLSVPQIETKSGRGGTIVRRIKNARSWPAYQASNKTLVERRKSGGLLDSNLTKKQAAAFLDMQTQLETVKADRDWHKGRAERFEKLNKTQGETIARYQEADLERSIKQAKQNRSILALIRRSK